MVMKLKYKRTTLISAGCIAILLGLYLAKLTTPISFSWIILAIIPLLILWQNKTSRLLLVIILCFVFGWWRGGLLQVDNQKYSEYYGKKVSVIATAQEDGFYAQNSQLEFTANNVSVNGESLPGKIKIKGYGEPAIYRYDKVEAVGKLYPSIGGRQANISYADISVIATTNSKLDDLRRNFIVGMETALPEPAASFGIGLLVGQRSLLPADVLATLTAVGLVHIIAVSGYNLTIIIDFIRRISARLSRFQVVFLASGLMYAFILITGFSPSIIRAALVSFLGLTAWYFGRKFNPILLIVLVACITGIANPYFVWGDIGWYLSFLAFTGILILAPQIIKLFKKDKLPIMLAIAIETFSAQIMTMPLIMAVFGRVSLVGFLANIIVVPLVPFAMLFSLIAGVAGMIVPAISGWIALPARVILNFILLVADWFSKLPHAQVSVKMTAFSMLACYISLVIVIIGLNKRNQSVKMVLNEE